jgi:hypothetical protein
MAKKQKNADVHIEREGGIFMVRPLSRKAKVWVKENVPLKSWQWLGGAFSVDQHYIENLVHGMKEAGLRLA